MRSPLSQMPVPVPILDPAMAQQPKPTSAPHAPEHRQRPMVRYQRALLATGTWALLFGVVVLWQSVSGAYRAELAAHADEAAHYVTGLMLRDYAASFFPTSPVRFAEQYYLHYPKVAIGHWPPVFYIIE